MSRLKTASVAAGLVADRMFGEPPLHPHPVALLGSGLRALEDQLYAPQYGAGAAHAVLGLAAGATAGWSLRSPALATYIAVAARNLGQAATEVATALDGGDLDRARRLLPSLVGRDPSNLDAKEVARAAVESVAENTVDALVAPALWAAVLGAPGAMGYRAVNTMDAMVGHRSPRYQRYGWASARLDDAANFLPARATALLVAAARPGRAGAVWRTVRRDAAAHPSPNAGIAEAAFAAALGLRLGGPNRYEGSVELRPPLGDGPPPEAADIARAVRLSGDVGAALLAALATVAVIGRRRSSQRGQGR